MVTELVKKHITETATTTTTGCWIGLRKPQGQNEYEWVTGEKVEYTDWKPNEPSMSSNDVEQYVLVSAR